MKVKKARKISREIQAEHAKEVKLPYKDATCLEKLPCLGRYFQNKRKEHNAAVLCLYIKTALHAGKTFAKKIQKELHNGK